MTAHITVIFSKKYVITEQNCVPKTGAFSGRYLIFTVACIYKTMAFVYLGL